MSMKKTALAVVLGAGFALAEGFQESGLTQWIGLQLDFLVEVHWLLLILVVAAVTLFLTELTSNTATSATLIPVLGGVALGVGMEPMGLLVPAALAANAVAIAWLPEAQAEVTPSTGPVSPCAMEVLTAAEDGMAFGTVKISVRFLPSRKTSR